jgi:hypothetical protein
VAGAPPAYLEPGTWSGYEITGRKRLVPAFGSRSLGELSVDEVRNFIAELAEAVEGGELAVKTVNNALGTLVVCLNDAANDGLMASNPALRVQRLPPGHIERDYLRLDEIPRYLDACSEVYRPLAELLIGGGLRISEALALRIGDLELEGTGGAMIVYRSRKGPAVGSTKSDRFRSVEIGPGLSSVLRDQVACGAEVAAGDRATAALFTMPIRTVERSQGRWESGPRIPPGRPLRPPSAPRSHRHDPGARRHRPARVPLVWPEEIPGEAPVTKQLTHERQRGQHDQAPDDEHRYQGRLRERLQYRCPALDQELANPPESRQRRRPSSRTHVVESTCGNGRTPATDQQSPLQALSGVCAMKASGLQHDAGRNAPTLPSLTYIDGAGTEARRSGG